MRFGRTSKAIGVAAVAAMALSACASTGGGNTASEGAGDTAAAGGTISVAETNAFSSFNSDTAAGNVDINGKIAYMTRGGFYHIDSELNVVRNEEFGTYEKLSDDPLVVKYTVNEGVQWSDGNAVDAADLMLNWVSESGYANDATVDPETGEVTEGTSYFDYAGDTSGLALTEIPEIGDDGRSITLTYSKPYADWEIVFGGLNDGGVGMPAHVIAEKAGLADEQALIDLIQGLERGDAANPADPNAELQSVADVYNTGFDTKSLPNEESLYLSSGPFVVDSITPDQSITLVRNESYDWGPTPNVNEITVRFIGAAPDQVQALENGEVDIIAPQPSADTVELLESIEGVTVEVDDQLAYDHIDLNYTGVFADENVREAFMKAVPRQTIVDRIVKPLKEDAAPLDSQFFVPAQEAYETSAASNGSDAYQEADIEGAKKLLNGETPEVRIMYNKDNPNRVDAFALIQESAEQAGFEIVDGGLGASDWGAALGTGTYDASIYGWINSGVGVSGVPQIFRTDSGSNYNGFSDPEADKLMDELMVTTDAAAQDEIITKIDKLVWDSFYGLPLFQSVGLDAYNSERVEGVVYQPNQTGVFWNFWDWKVKGE
ncbi:ABC transporter family substrate-binding protein [Arthrobacter crystallopoietes]|uniref:ABC transporter family substrate-binding protein n=1 Tax=Crystallibacter crystallopoietes TaxID=37928 RepID=UPI00111102AC|nr:ABC transporter family substrate-binding protein [Arthrobacter crystallopoietes]QTG80733.1 ABC transporter family substrate-binding protein [Arthrobacter crystallopoietes]